MSESVKHEIESLLARPIAYYGAPDPERHSLTHKDEPVTEEASKDKLIRLEERLGAQGDQLSRIERMIESVQRENASALKELAQAFNKAFDRAAAEYVTKAEFAPVKASVFAVIGLMGAGVVGALLAQVIIQ